MIIVFLYSDTIWIVLTFRTVLLKQQTLKTHSGINILLEEYRLK